MPPIGAALADREVVGEPFAGTDTGKAHPRNTVELERDEQAVPVDRAVLGERVGDVEPRLLAFAQSHQRPGNRPVYRHGMSRAVAGGEMVIADELLTPDSSRFWPAENWNPGATPVSLDKQPVRDATEATGWDKSPPAPPLSTETIQATRDRYVTAYERITGESFAQWIGAS